MCEDNEWDENIYIYIYADPIDTHISRRLLHPTSSAWVLLQSLSGRHTSLCSFVVHGTPFSLKKAGRRCAVLLISKVESRWSSCSTQTTLTLTPTLTAGYGHNCYDSCLSSNVSILQGQPGLRLLAVCLQSLPFPFPLLVSFFPFFLFFFFLFFVFSCFVCACGSLAVDGFYLWVLDFWTFSVLACKYASLNFLLRFTTYR